MSFVELPHRGGQFTTTSPYSHVIVILAVKLLFREKGSKELKRKHTKAEGCSHM